MKVLPEMGSLPVAFGVMMMASGLASGQADGVKRAIVSPQHRMDSRGETVYETQGDDQTDEPVVPGVLVSSHSIKAAKPKYSSALKKEKFAGTITLYGVISASGDAIDIAGMPGEDVEAIACAKKAVEQSRFAPATLDGKPVAILIKVIIKFTLL